MSEHCKDCKEVLLPTNLAKAVNAKGVKLCRKHGATDDLLAACKSAHVAHEAWLDYQLEHGKRISTQDIELHDKLHSALDKANCERE